MKWNTLFFLLPLFCMACNGPLKDEQKIIGKWQSDDSWFEYNQDNTYNSGRAMLTMVKQFKYTLDATSKELSLYTDDKERTYYLIYEFRGNDTLAVRNRMSTNKTFINFVRVKNK